MYSTHVVVICELDHWLPSSNITTTAASLPTNIQALARLLYSQGTAWSSTLKHCYSFQIGCGLFSWNSIPCFLGFFPDTVLISLAYLCLWNPFTSFFSEDTNYVTVYLELATCTVCLELATCTVYLELATCTVCLELATCTSSSHHLRNLSPLTVRWPWWRWPLCSCTYTDTKGAPSHRRRREGIQLPIVRTQTA